MNDKTKNHLWVLFIICFAIFGGSMMAIMVANKAANKVHFTDVRVAAAVDENMAPVNVTTFPQGTTKVFCWFQWQDSEVNTQIVAKWDYVTDQIHILDYTFSIPRRSGMGSISLSMPEGKVMPSGEYLVTLMLEKQTLKSLTFEIQ